MRSRSWSAMASLETRRSSRASAAVRRPLTSKATTSGRVVATKDTAGPRCSVAPGFSAGSGPVIQDQALSRSASGNARISTPGSSAPSAYVIQRTQSCPVTIAVRGNRCSSPSFPSP